MDYPQLYRNEDGVEIEALNEIHAALFEREGFVPVDGTKRVRKPKIEE